MLFAPDARIEIIHPSCILFTSGQTLLLKDLCFSVRTVSLELSSHSCRTISYCCFLISYLFSRPFSHEGRAVDLRCWKISQQHQQKLLPAHAAGSQCGKEENM